MSHDEAPLRRLSGPSEQDEQASAERLRLVLERMSMVIDRHSRLAAIQPQARSELASDNNITDPAPLGHLATYAQGVAIDYLKAMGTLLLQDSELTLYQVAQYPLLRAAIEATAEVVWLLGPDDQRERVRRLLVARASEYVYDRRLVAGAGAPLRGDKPALSKQRAQMRQTAAANHKTNLKMLRTIAGRAGIADEEFLDQDLPWPDFIAYAAQHALQPVPEVGVTLWRVASGFTHPSSSRSLMLSVIEEDGPRNGNVINARVSASVQNVTSTATGALAFVQTAEKLMRFRKVKVASS